MFLLLSRVYQLARKIADKTIAKFNITLAEYNFLRIIQNNAGITAKQASDRLYATAPSVAQLVQSLEKKKLIGRQKNTEDGRVQHLNLTPDGVALVKKLQSDIRGAAKNLKIPDSVLKMSISSLSELLSCLSSFSYYGI